MRYRILLVAVLLFGSLLLTGCVSVGTDFNYHRVNDLVLGEKPAVDYEVMFGTPRAVKSRKDPDGEFKQIVYFYAVMYEGARLLTLEYRDDKVNAYYYSTNFDEERTETRTKHFNMVEIGQTKEEVEQLLGRPNGRALCPCYLEMFEEHCSLGNEIWVWKSLNKSNNNENSSSEAVSMFIVFDRKDAVVNMLQEQLNLDD